jgi:hypothetical protein
MLAMKHARMAPLQMDRTVLQGSFVSIQAPRKRPVARRRKKMEIL